jgi:3-hydroxymyristoyl/3-hydroxydecanoyl-(acyl carrier protein) dehydratase
VIQAPEIRATERTACGVRLTLSIPADLQYFDGHFPEVPILPGVVQVMWAVECARQQLGLDARFRALSGVKFMRVIQPGATVALQLDYASDRSELDFEYSVDGRACSSGTVRFDRDDRARA